MDYFRNPKRQNAGGTGGEGSRTREIPVILRLKSIWGRGVEVGLEFDCLRPSQEPKTGEEPIFVLWREDLGRDEAKKNTAMAWLDSEFTSSSSKPFPRQK